MKSWAELIEEGQATEAQRTAMCKALRKTIDALGYEPDDMDDLKLLADELQKRVPSTHPHKITGAVIKEWLDGDIKPLQGELNAIKNLGAGTTKATTEAIRELDAASTLPAKRRPSRRAAATVDPKASEAQNQFYGALAQAVRDTHVSQSYLSFVIREQNPGMEIYQDMMRNWLRLHKPISTEHLTALVNVVSDPELADKHRFDCQPQAKELLSMHAALSQAGQGGAGGLPSK